MGEDYFCESAITELSSSLAEFGKFVAVSLGVTLPVAASSSSLSLSSAVCY